MQRRAAAIYVVFFVVVAIAAYSLTTVAEEPTVSIEGQNYTEGDTFRAGGTAWMVNVSGGSGEISSVNQSARFTETLANNSTILFQNGVYRPVPNGSGGGAAGTGTGSASPSGTATGGGTGTPGTVGTSAPTVPGAAGTSGTVFRVDIENTSASGGNASGGNESGENASGNASGTNVTTFTLREGIDVESELQADSDVENALLTDENGTRYVQYRNGTTEPLDEYLPEPETRNVSVGDSFPYAGNSTTVESVNSSAATLEWRGPLKRSQELEEGANVTLGGTTYVTHFAADNSTVVLSQNVSGYQAELDEVEHFHDRILGLWGIVIISLFAAILIAGLAYMPVRG